MVDIDKDELFRLHITEGKKIDDIADIYGVSHGTISKLFKQAKKIKNISIE